MLIGNNKKSNYTLTANPSAIGIIISIKTLDIIVDPKLVAFSYIKNITSPQE